MRINNLSPAAERVHMVRQTLILDSNEVRLGNDHDPEQTARRLTAAAMELFYSEASEFEKVATINQAHANLLGGGVTPETLHHMAGLSLRALDIAFPGSDDAFTNNLNREEIMARLEAIDLTSASMPFIGAYGDAWERRGQPTELMLVRNQELIESMLAKNRRQQVAELSTGALKPTSNNTLQEVEVTPIPHPRNHLTRLRDALIKR